MPAVSRWDAASWQFWVWLKAYSFLYLKPTFLRGDEFLKHLFANFIDRGQEMFSDRMDIMPRNGCRLLHFTQCKTLPYHCVDVMIYPWMRILSPLKVDQQESGTSKKNCASHQCAWIQVLPAIRIPIWGTDKSRFTSWLRQSVVTLGKVLRVSPEFVSSSAEWG